MAVRKKSKPTTTGQSKEVREALVASSPIVTEEEVSTSPMQRKYVIGVLVVLAIAGILYANRGLFIAAMVNGQPITRLSVINELEKQGGKQTLNTLVTKTLVVQEANKKHITVGKPEIDTEMKKIEESVSKQGQNLDQLLSLQGMSRQSLEEQIRIQKLIEKMVGSDIAISDKEITDYIEKNKDSLSSITDQTQLRDSVKQQIKQQKLSEKYQALIQKLQKDAKISYFVAY